MQNEAEKIPQTAETQITATAEAAPMKPSPDVAEVAQVHHEQQETEKAVSDIQEAGVQAQVEKEAVTPQTEPTKEFHEIIKKAEESRISPKESSFWEKVVNGMKGMRSIKRTGVS